LSARSQNVPEISISSWMWISFALKIRRKCRQKDLPVLYMRTPSCLLFIGGANLHLEDWDSLLTFGV